MPAVVLIGRLGRCYDAREDCIVPVELKQCQLVTVSILECNSWALKHRNAGGKHTISSLQIGHESCAPGATGAADIEVSPFSRDIREVRSCVPEENCDADVCELRETLLAVGESTLFGCGDGDGAESALGVPKTRPPPSVLRAIITRT